MKNTIMVCLVAILAVACGGRVEYDARNGNGSDPGATPTAPPVEFPSDPVPSDPPPFTGNDGGIAGSSGSGGSGGSIATGGTSGEAGRAGAGGEADSGPPTDAGCKPMFHVEWLTHSEAAVCPGDVSVKTLTVKLTAECGAMKVKEMPFVLVAPDFAWTDSTPFCKAPCASPEDWYFQNFKLVAADGTTVMGPIQNPSVETGNRMAIVKFTDTLTLSEGESVTLTLQMDVAITFDSPLPETRIHAILDGLTMDNESVPVHTSLNFDTDATVVSITECNAPELAVSLATSPVSSTHVKKEQDVETAGITATTAPKSLTLESMTLTGQAQIGTDCSFGTQCARKAFASRVILLRMFDGSIQVGLAAVPDPMTGKAVITGMNVKLASFSTKTFTVKATLASTASATEPYDQFAVGVEMGSDVVARDSQSNAINASMSQQLQWQAYGETPLVVQTIRPSGTLTIVDDSHPASAIVVGGKDAWVPFARYKATVEYESAKIDRIRVTTPPFPAGQRITTMDFTSVAVAMNGQVMGWDILPQGNMGAKDIDLSSNPIAVSKDSAVTFELWGKVAAPVSSTVASTYSPMSGDVPALGLSGWYTTGEWDVNYTNAKNVRTTGSVSGERLYAPLGGAGMGNSMVLRKSKPTVVPLPLPTNLLTNGIDQELYKLLMTPDVAGSVSWNQVTFTCSASSNLSISNVGLRRGYQDLGYLASSVYGWAQSTSAWTSADGIYHDVMFGSLTGATNYTINVKMNDGYEEVIAGSGNVYTLHATVDGGTSGSSILCTPLHGADSGVVTSWPDASQNGGAFYQFVLSIPGNPQPIWFNAGFVWSDMSEVPHSASFITGLGSKDWTNGYLIEDLTGSSLLYVP